MTSQMIDSLKELIRKENKKFCEEIATFVEYSLNKAKKKLTEEIINLLPPVTEPSGQMPSNLGSSLLKPVAGGGSGGGSGGGGGDITGDEVVPRKRVRLGGQSSPHPSLPPLVNAVKTMPKSTGTSSKTAEQIGEQINGDNSVSTEKVAKGKGRTDEQKKKRKERESTTEGSAAKKRYDQQYYERVRKPRMLAEQLAKGK